MGLICAALQLYVLAIFARIVLSWFPLQPGGAVESVNRVLRTVTDPVLEPVRRMLPPVGMFDLSPLVVSLAIQIVLIPIICST